MKNIIIGTAGHIDHGKTALIRALTGKETDRWEEEKRRGITIDLGFTYFDLPSGDRAGIIDVPGHEKFVNNMLAGVIGMDLVMLVVAADEGMMPQTREHVDIMSQLGVDKSIVVLNKCDLVDDEWKELVKEEIKEELIGSVFENANMIEVSAVTGEGIDNLIQEIVHMTKDELAEKDINTIPRLPIDRSFSISGFGTIVTGTLISGSIKKDDELEIYPTGQKAKIRSIQVHGKDVKECFAGQRSAINISNLKKDEIKRGYVLAPPNSLEDTMMLDVKLNVLNSSERILSNRCRLHLFTGTSEVLCRAVLLDVEEASPGDSCYAQLRLEEKIAVRRGDKFIVRFYSPLETVGGGVILDANPTKKTPFNKAQLEEIKRKEEGSHSDIVELLVKKHPEMITIKEIGKLTGLSVEEVSECINELKEENLVLTYEMKKDIYVYHSSEEMRLKRETIEFIKNFHNENPYKFGV
ncbi:selenocysteine-specific translation elongation factor [Clostridium perfringens]|uniref:selenocysteine-specific translation elongation factor n=1 Tax=Clostridium perfringens TaxID=1502 RepID=UPI002ACBF938|nr:selenocysteine-specific translation elongation factor [Clostridium perfringens]